MSAREWPEAALKAMHQAMFEDAFDGTTLPMLGAGADAFAAAITGAGHCIVSASSKHLEDFSAIRLLLDLDELGYRILAPGALDRETLEAAAKLVEAGSISTGSEGDTVIPRFDGDRSGLAYATAIRALGGGDKEDSGE